MVEFKAAIGNAQCTIKKVGFFGFLSHSHFPIIHARSASTHSFILPVAGASPRLLLYVCC